MATKKKSGSEFVRWFGPLLEALRQLGGSAPLNEAIDKVAELERVTPQERDVVLKSGAERFANQVQWARQYLVWEGLIDSKKRGQWTLTPKGLTTTLTLQEAQSIVLERMRQDAQARRQKNQESEPLVASDSIELNDTEQADSEAELNAFLSVIRGLSPAGFERICKRVLHEAGLEKLKVTGQSNDGGIDGVGVLQVNDLVKFNVVFQCKKWVNPVPPKEVRDLRGAMAGRADKAIFLTTSTFTSNAKEEALRPGTDPIELVDGEKLLDLFKKYEIGLKPRTVYDIDHQFFKAFEDEVE